MAELRTKLILEIINLIPHQEIINEFNLLPQHILATINKYICLKHLDHLSVQFNEIIEIETAIDYIYAELNTGHWSEVPIYFREAFTLLSFIKVLGVLCFNKNMPYIDTYECVINLIDIGLLLGAPLKEYEHLLNNTIQVLKRFKYDEKDLTKKYVPQKCIIIDRIKDDEYNKLNGIEVTELDCPSVAFFQQNHFVPKFPVKLLGCLKDWPALKKWANIEYLLNIAGDRTVPIEIGSHYLDEGWSQKLMTLREFIEKHFSNDTNNVCGYLAQHNLFDQIPELKEDILTPDYCCVTEEDESSIDPDINAWFGPQGTISPLHTDPKNNLLCQVFGTKQVIMYSPLDNENVYPHEEKMLNNTSKVNPLDPNLEIYPKFIKTKMYKCLLKPGEMLYIPPEWWHHVTALEKSFSVSFWWY